MTHARKTIKIGKTIRIVHELSLHRRLLPLAGHQKMTRSKATESLNIGG